MIEILIWLDLTVLTYLSKFCLDTMNQRTNDDPCFSVYFCLTAFSLVFLFLIRIVFTSFSNFDMQRFHEFSAKNDLFTSCVSTKSYSVTFLTTPYQCNIFVKIAKKTLLKYQQILIKQIQVSAMVRVYGTKF